MKTLHGVGESCQVPGCFIIRSCDARIKAPQPVGRLIARWGPGASTRTAQSCPVSSPLVEGELQEVTDIDQTEDEADRCGHDPTALVMDEPGRREATRSPPRFERASTICQHVADPIRVGPIGQGNDVAIASPEDVDGGAVLTPRPPPGVDDDTEHGQARCQTAEQAVRHPAVSACNGARQRHGKSLPRVCDVSVVQKLSRIHPALVDQRSVPDRRSPAALARENDVQ